LGTLHSTLVTFLVDLAVRARIFQRAPLSVDAGPWAGALPFLHQAESSFQPFYAEAGIGWDAFVATQVALGLGGCELFLEARGSLASVRTQQLSDAYPGGVI